MIVISDTTPLITLMKAAKLNLLHELFGEIIIPEAMHAELTCNSEFQDEADLINKSDFIKVVSVLNRETVSALQRATGLDLGESEAIVYADENKADLLLVDEAHGRQVALNMGIAIMGSVGILLTAYREGLLSTAEAEDSFHKIIEARRHIDKSIFEKALAAIHGGKD